MTTTCPCNCDPCWICGSRPVGLSLAMPGYASCCAGVLVGSYGIAPLGSTGGVLVWDDDVMHDTFGTEQIPTLESPKAKSPCQARWDFRATDSTYLYDYFADPEYPIYAEHLGPICQSGNGSGYDWWLFINRATVVVQLSTGVWFPPAAATVGSSRLQVIVTEYYIWQRRNLAPFEFYRQSTYWVDFPKPCRSLSGTYAVPERTVYIGPYIAEQLPSEFYAAYMDGYNVVEDCTFDDDAQFDVEIEF